MICNKMRIFNAKKSSNGRKIAIESFRREREHAKERVEKHPKEVLSVADFHLLARGSEDFSLSRRDAVVIKNLDLSPKNANKSKIPNWLSLSLRI